MSLLACVGLAMIGCTHLPMQRAVPARKNADLLEQARAWNAESGLMEARRRLTQALGEMGQDGGALESRLLRTNQDKSFYYPDSLGQFGLAERGSTGLFFVLGYRGEEVRSERIIRETVAALQAQGWHARLVEVEKHRSTSEDAMVLHRVLSRELPLVDRAALVGFSKGGADCLQWFAGPGMQLPLAERKKIRLFLTVAGVLRGSRIADWIASDWGLTARALRQWVRLTESDGAAAVAELSSMAEDPWLAPKKPALRRVAPLLEVVHIVSVPNGKDGFPGTDPNLGKLGRCAGACRPEMGPNDGMVESAAQILPEEAGVVPRIIRVFGSHAVLDSFYPNGARVAKNYRMDHNGEEHWKSGLELMDDLLRAMPARLVGK